MNIFRYIALIFIISFPASTIAGFFQIVNRTDDADYSITAPYDLRDRSSYIQVSNISNSTVNIHVQIFQHDRNCDELDFDDTLTANDTIIYNLDNIIKNDGSPAPINLLDNSSGYVVVTIDEGDGTFNQESFPAPLVGNLRIIDNSSYEYRVNMSGYRRPDSVINNAFANFNTVDNANQADVIGYSVLYNNIGMEDFSSTVQNFDEGVNYGIFVYDMDEEPLSCDIRNFACGKVMNYGINEDYPNSKGGPLLCPGGGLANPDGGYILFLNNPNPVNEPEGLSVRSFGFIGLNNGNSTGSMDVWHGDLD